MKTADLIKKKEEEKNKPLQETTTTSMPTSPKPTEGMSMAEARMAGNGVPVPDSITGEQTSNNTINPVSLYEVGKQAGNINQAENTLAGKSPITTPEYEKFRNEVIGAQQFGVETPEQAAARERRDYIKQGLTGLTEGLSSLANLYYTTKWAPNQKIVSQMSALQQQLYRERLERDRKLDNFRAWQRDKARRDEDRAYQDKIFNINRNDRLAREAAEAKQRQENFKMQFDYKAERDKVADQRYKDETEYRRGQDEIANKHRAAQLAETQRYHDAMISNRSNSSKDGRTSVIHGNNDTSILNTPNGFMNVDWKKVDPVAKNQLYKIVPEEIRNKYPLIDEYGEYNEKYATSQMNAAIAEAAVADDKIAKWLVDSKAGAYQQQTQGEQPDKEQQQPSGSKWDAFDVSSFGKTDFSKQKRPTGQGASANVASSNMSNVDPVQTEVQTPEAPQGNVFDQLSAKYKKEDADEKEAKNLKMQQNIAKIEAEIRDSLELANKYQMRLDELNRMQMLDPRQYSGSRKREIENAVNETVREKERLKKEIKELRAKAKNLNKEYEKLYQYKKQ